MITNISDTKEIDRIIRSILITQSELDGNFVRNALSEYGADLDKPGSGSIFQTITPSDSLILFRTENRSANFNMSETNKNNSITYYKAYVTKIIIYGASSDMLGAKLVARLRSEKVRDALQESGVWLEGVSDTDCVDEYLNGVMWSRTDFNINIGVQISVAQIENVVDFSQYSDIDVEVI